MQQQSLLSLCRLEIPEANSTDAISDANLLIILNLACTEFVNRTKALPTSATFNLVLNQTEYALSTYVTDFGEIRKEGLWIYNASTSKWVQFYYPITIEVLKRDYPDFMNTAAGFPQRYSLDGDTLTIHPKASSTYAGTAYLKLFYYKRSTDMAGSTQYPFSGSTTVRYPHLADYEPELIEYVRHKVKRMLGKNADAEASLQKFYVKCEEIKRKLKDRPDLISSVQANGAGNVSFYQGAFKR